MISSKKWLILYLVFLLLFIIGIIGIVAYIDPFMHYHMPLSSQFNYPLDNQRSQNDGIVKYFDYDAVVTGTSMTENFMKTEVDSLFQVNCVKVPFMGATYKEINDNLIVSLGTHPNVKMVIRGLDMNAFFDHEDDMYDSPRHYPTYLYNDNPFDDVNYLLNRDVLYVRIWNILSNRLKGATPGVTSFDRYSYWSSEYTYGRDTVFLNETEKRNQFENPVQTMVLSEEEKEIISCNIEKNVTSLADAYPEVEFYYFITPYCAVWWGEKYEDGMLEKQIAAEKMIIEQILPHSNIRLFSWNDIFELTTDLNHYKDPIHYGDWVNSWMLGQMKSDIGRLTSENYLEYLDREYRFYHTFDYNSLFGQEDYEDDSIAAELLKSKAS